MFTASLPEDLFVMAGSEHNTRFGPQTGRTLELHSLSSDRYSKKQKIGTAKISISSQEFTCKPTAPQDTSETTSLSNYIVINQVPIRKWVCVIIRIQNTMLDVYINGTISSSSKFIYLNCDSTTNETVLNAGLYFNKNGNRYTRKSKTFTSEPHKEKASTARTKADTAAKHADAAKSQDYDAGPRKVRKDGETHYYIGKKKCSKDDYDAAMLKIDKRASQAKRLAAMGEDASGKTCNKSSKGKRCPVHGLQECGMVYEGEDEGKPGKNFAKIAKSAGKQYGSKEAGERVAGAVRNKLKKQGKLEESHAIFKRHVRIVNESLAYLLSENEEDKAKAITAAGDIVNDYTSWMQRVGQYQTKSMIELSDSIRGDFGVQQAEAFKNAVGPALSATLEVLTAQREAISNAVAVLAGEQIPETPMGAEPAMEPGMEPAGPDMMNEPADEFGAADAAAGAGTPGREMRESASQRRARRLAESHSIMSKLAR
jgi:hypothetical protein